MKAIILAAGEGVRMRPLTLKIPKPLLKIHGRPILDYVFDAFPEEITEVIVVVGYLGEQIRNYLGSEYRGRKIIYAEGSSKGTAYSFLAAKDFIAPGERFLFLYGDEYLFRENIEQCLKHPRSILLFRAPKPEVTGVALLDRDGFIKEIEEKPKKPKSSLSVDGIMVLDTNIFSYEPFPNEKGEFYLTSLLNCYVREHKTRGVLAKDFIGDITTPEDLERVERAVSRSIPRGSVL